MLVYEGLLREHFGGDADGDERIEHLEELRRSVGRVKQGR